MTVYRLVRKDRATLDGKGAALFSGRWNTENIPCLYTSTSPSLAQLEVMVNMDDWKVFLTVPHVLLHITLPKKRIKEIPQAVLPADWGAAVPSHTVQKFGTSLLNDLKVLAFSVPSSVSKLERNVIINPRSVDFKLVEIVKKSLFKFDERLLR